MDPLADKDLAPLLFLQKELSLLANRRGRLDHKSQRLMIGHYVSTTGWHSISAQGLISHVRFQRSRLRMISKEKQKRQVIVLEGPEIKS